jgi:hypothetical protein
MTRPLNATIDALTALLASEKEALLSGDFVGVGAAAKEKAALAEELDRQLTNAQSAASLPALRGKLAKIAQISAENERLLEAAKNGVLSARSRLKDIVYRERNVGVYAEGGAKVMSAEAGVTRRKSA